MERTLYERASLRMIGGAIACLMIGLCLPGDALANKPLRWFGYAYTGKAVEDSFLDVHTELYNVDYIDTRLVAIGGGKELYHGGDWYTLEAEGQIAHYINGVNDHAELNGALTARWQYFPWDRWLDTSAAFGIGLSLASDTPAVEARTADTTSLVLIYLLAEIDVMIPGQDSWSVFSRTHHRSSAFESIAGSDAASNTLAFGVKKRF